MTTTQVIARLRALARYLDAEHDFARAELCRIAARRLANIAPSFARCVYRSRPNKNARCILVSGHASKHMVSP